MNKIEPIPKNKKLSIENSSLTGSPVHQLVKKKVTIKIPKLLLSEVDFLLDFSNFNREDLFNLLIFQRLEDLHYDSEMLFSYLFEYSDFKERYRVGLNQYYRKEEYKNNCKTKSEKKDNSIFQEISFTLKLPEELYIWVERFSEKMRSSIEELLSEFIQIRLGLLYDCPELMFDLFSRECHFLRELKKGLEIYHSNTQKMREIKDNG